MIEPGSLVGFALVFFACTWAASALAGLLLMLSRPSLRRRGAGAEKRAAAVALIIAPVLGGIVTLALAGFSVVAPWLSSGDHCPAHGHHLHLCLRHGGEWADRAWALTLVSALSAILLVRLARLGESLWRGYARLRFVEHSSSQIVGDGIPVLVAPSERDFCFVAGIRRPRIYVSASLWTRLSDAEREAMLEHERVHIEHGDLLQSVILTACALVGAPLLAGQCKRLWSEATERYCDRVAADETGSTEDLASALLRMARGPRPIGIISFVPRPESLEDRVMAVLSQDQTGKRTASRIGWASAALVASVVCTTAVLADPLHHTLETLLARI